jgi:serine/threonine protein kinase
MASVAAVQKKKKKLLVSTSNAASLTTLYAMKSIRLGRKSRAFQLELQNEIRVVSDLDHPNIVKFYQVYYQQKQIYIIMELCSGGDLYTRKPYTEQAAKDITSQILQAVAYMHSKGYVHRDLKMENIMFESESTNAQVKIIDFGLSVRYDPNHPMRAQVGTIATMSPEVLAGKYTSQCDLWSIGVIAYELLFGCKPFDSTTLVGTLQNIGLAHYTFPTTPTVSEEAKDLIRALLQKHPEQRPTAKQALFHPWLEQQEEKDYCTNNYPEEIQLDSDKDDEASSTELTQDSCRCRIRNKDDEASSSTELSQEGSNTCQRRNRSGSFINRISRGSRSSSCCSVKSCCSSSSSNNFFGEANSEHRDALCHNLVAYVQSPEIQKLVALLAAHQASPEEVGEFREVFRQVDLDKTGSISLSEFQRGFSECQCGGGKTTEDIFNGIDAFHDGTISYTEFLAATLATHGFLTKARIQQAFEQLDDDQNGFISVDDLRTILGQDYSPEWADRILADADWNKDGNISYAEFLRAFKNPLIPAKPEVVTN